MRRSAQNQSELRRDFKNYELWSPVRRLRGPICGQVSEASRGPLIRVARPPLDPILTPPLAECYIVTLRATPNSTLRGE